jgi:hypothetical protein
MKTVLGANLEKKGVRPCIGVGLSAAFWQSCSDSESRGHGFARTISARCPVRLPSRRRSWITRSALRYRLSLVMPFSLQDLPMERRNTARSANGPVTVSTPMSPFSVGRTTMVWGAATSYRSSTSSSAHAGPFTASRVSRGLRRYRCPKVTGRDMATEREMRESVPAARIKIAIVCHFRATRRAS